MKAIIIRPDGSITVEDVHDAAESVAVLHEGEYVTLGRSRLARGVGVGTEIAVAFARDHTPPTADQDLQICALNHAGLWLPWGRA